MSSIVLSDRIRIPGWVDDFASFRRWTLSDQFPVQGWYSHLNGDLWADVSMETLAHNQIKVQIGAVLTYLLLRKQRTGRFIADRMRLVNFDVLLSTEPDGMFLAQRSLEQDLVTLKEGDECLEVLGTPDMVLEITSKTSVEKDTIVLPDLYFRAGIAEYWLVDSRPEHFGFQIFRPGKTKYVAVREVDGWIKSRVFGKSFKLTRKTAADAASNYRLQVR